ncbi:glycosyltransferase [Acidianus rod-shaped virus 1]|uniref:Putative glycosyl transferase n=1 Tax=Acidianus rod-shaped virus 1 TaxID=309181 RepID=Q50I48_9VIRU|nr:glycosyltransferase [Acidianus rod-shaped virus 1]CAI44178.1 putative glycosyl transferase [Acidianus rod-shaped virus 1]
MKTLVLTMNYSSIRNVAEDISETIGNAVVDITPELYINTTQHFERLIVFVPFIPPMLNNYLLVYNMFKGPKYFYTTADGVPSTDIINRHLLRDVTFIPNSNFTAENLSTAGLSVDIPVFHGINFKIVEKAKSLVPKLKQKLDNDFPDTIKFGVVTGMTKRKNIDLFVQTTKLLNEKFPDPAKRIHFFVISHEDFKKLEVPANVHFVAAFGHQPRENVLAFYGAMDFTFMPTGCEGFGLPLLESMAMGTPVIHQAIPPLTEFTSWQWNYLFRYNTVENYADKDHAQSWKIYRFQPEDAAAAILTAFLSQDREERSMHLMELAKKYDVSFLYKRFLET